jgi:hypothetical protein
MRKFLWFFLALVVALAGWSTVYADDGFFVISGMRVNYAPVSKTGQTTSQAAGDDGTWKKGVASPTHRFINNGNGTVTDRLTGLIWLKNANAFGQRTWTQAITDANNLANGQHGLTDGSKEGDWRLPNVRELQSLIDYSKSGPALPGDQLFTDVQSSSYWSSTAYASEFAPAAYAWFVYFGDGHSGHYDKEIGSFYVWCVRGGT